MSKFRERAERAIKDVNLHIALERATSQLGSRRSAAFDSLENAEVVRDRARNIKLRTLSELDFHLERFEERLRAKGVHVHWAETGEEANRIVMEIARAGDVQGVVKSKSMVTEEIHLNDALIEAGLDVVETDFGEYIVQLAQDRPSHIVAPIIHMTREDVGKLFEDRLSIPFTDDPERLARHARVKLRKKFLLADMGITGANFGVSETGTICLISNEGNIRMVTSLPRVHVAILGIEKIIPSLGDLELFLRLLPRSGTGQKLTVYTSLVQSPRLSYREEGPEEIHVVLLDNGRSHILAGEQAEILTCIRCGACLNVCPVYRIIGGHAYGDTYPGPMGAVLTPCLRGIPAWYELPHASSLCGACKDICPMKIDIPRMLLSLRRASVEAGYAGTALRLFMRMFAMVATRPRLYRQAWRLGRLLSKENSPRGWIRRGYGPLSAWTRDRDFPVPQRISFQEWWRNTEKNDGR
jgi:L-lactate dehydrogenase complex protein LldF